MKPSENSKEIKIIRIYDAPVEVVWKAWTDPNETAKWWGPRGFTLTTYSKELKVGGTWVYTMHGPDGTDYPNKTIYYEVEENKKLVYDHGANDENPPLFRVIVFFSETNGKTKMDMTMEFSSPEKAEESVRFIKKAGGNATWDRLAEHLEKASTGKEKFVINRTFDASMDVMFEMWTNPEHFSKWLPPSGFEMKFLRADIREGGSTFYYMNSGELVKMYGRAEYLKIEKPNSLMYRQMFTDENEKLSRHPLAPTFPAKMLTIVEFNSEGPERTRVTVTWEAIDCTPEEIDTFVNARSGMTQGWTGSFDKLEAYLIKH